MAAMATPLVWLDALEGAGRTPGRWALAAWRVVHLGAMLLVLMLSPSSYQRNNRTALAQQIYLDTVPLLPGFTLLCAVISLVLTRILVTTAASYGLSQYALEMVIRVLVLELIPLTAALFVALRCTIPHGANLARMRRRGELDALRQQGIDPVGRELLPRVVAGVFSTITLAALTCVITMVLAYLAVFGFTWAGMGGYTHMFGQVFNPAVTLVFVLKTVFFSVVVALMPVASALNDPEGHATRLSAEMQGLVRVFAMLLVIELVSLVGNYY
jgi:phospholipid/cholesterol/gamma-HCH transport system permease protein